MNKEAILNHLSNRANYIQSINKIEQLIGPDDNQTSVILECLLNTTKSPLFLRPASLILLEGIDFKKNLLLLLLIFQECSSSEIEKFLFELSRSKYYVQRLAVSYLIRIFYFDLPDILRSEDSFFQRIETLHHSVCNNRPFFDISILDGEIKQSFQEIKLIVLPLLQDEIEYVTKTSILVLGEFLKFIFDNSEIKSFANIISKEKQIQNVDDTGMLQKN